MAEDMVPRHEVVDFLSSFKTAMGLGFFGLKPREKNMQGLVELGITVLEAKDIIAGLTPDNYEAGPKPDDTDPDKDVWMFGALVNGKETYIKLRLAQDLARRACSMLQSGHFIQPSFLSNTL